jgi:hypothetical protein
MMINEHDCVVLAQDVPEEGVMTGDSIARLHGVGMIARPGRFPQPSDLKAAPLPARSAFATRSLNGGWPSAHRFVPAWSAKRNLCRG